MAMGQAFADLAGLPSGGIRGAQGVRLSPRQHHLGLLGKPPPPILTNIEKLPGSHASDPAMCCVMV
jgi:hypothetical protein